MTARPRSLSGSSRWLPNAAHEPGAPRANGADLQLPDGRWLRTNNDGSQDEGDRGNDDVLLDFFAPFADGAQTADAETRLIAINAGRLVDFLTAHRERFAKFGSLVHAGLAGEPPRDDIVVVNLNQRSLVAGDDKRSAASLRPGARPAHPRAPLGGLRRLRTGQDLLRSAQRTDVRPPERGAQGRQATA